MTEVVDYITIDNKDYIIIDEIEINRVKYVYLTEEENIENIKIKKVNIINNKEVLVSLDSEEELNKALNAFKEKNNV